MNPAMEAFLQERTIAVVGMSRGKGFANGAARALRAAGHRVLPVNDQADEIGGERCYRSVAAIPEPVGAVLVVVPPSRSAAVVAECVRLGIRKVWLQQGAESPEAIRVARDAGLDLVERECVIMYAKPRGIHRVHRWLHDRRQQRAVQRTT